MDVWITAASSMFGQLLLFTVNVLAARGLAQGGVELFNVIGAEVWTFRFPNTAR